MTIQAIETRYAGCRFRSRLEARWAVFFDTLGVRWEYEAQGFLIQRVDGTRTPYLPDFRLPEFDTWVEVKGAEEDLNPGLIEDAVHQLPSTPCKNSGPTLLILGPIPDPPGASCDLGWLGLSGTPNDIEMWRTDGYDWPECCGDAYYGFGGVRHAGALERLDISGATNYWGYGPWTEPCTSYQSMNEAPGVPDAYIAARSARFEHGENAR